MADGIYIALSGAVAQSMALETTAANLANAGTDGYQRVRTTFREALGAAQQKVPSRATTVSGTTTDTTVGEARSTGNALDCLLPKGTYLTVETPRGDRFTRAGSMHVDKDGYLAIATGERVLGESGKPIRAGVDAKLSPSGEVSGGDGEGGGRLRLVTFARPEALVHEGGTLMAGSPTSGAATASKATIDVGALESSNARVVDAMTDLIGHTRSFEAFERAIETFKEADKRMTTVVGPG